MDGVAWASSAMVAARERLEIAAGNLANASTDGFARVVARGSLTARGVVISRGRDGARGALRRTGRDLDMAIVGDGAFIVRDASGVLSRTRDGAFLRNRDGSLSDARGRRLVRTELPHGSSVRTGFLETSGVDAIGAMIDVMSAERSFESAQKIVTAIDTVRQKAADGARVK